MPSILVEDKTGSQHQLSGAQQAAALLLSIDSSAAARLLKRLDPDELRQVTRAIASLSQVQGSVVETLAERFLETFSDLTNLQGGAERAKNLLAGAFAPEEVAEVLSDAIGSAKVDVWPALAGLPEQLVAHFLETEHPQVVTYVLSKLEALYVSRLVPLLPREMRNEALATMISPVTLPEGPARIIEDVLRENLLQSKSSAAIPGSECARVAGIINSLDASDFERVLSDVREAYPEEAKLISRMIFAFEDMPHLSRRALTMLLEKVPTDLVVLALRGTSGEFRKKVLSPMASRARRVIENELNGPSMTSPRDVTKARKDMAALVISLAQRGEFELPSFESGNESEALEAR